MSFADMHTHSEYSHDSVCRIEDMLNAQKRRGSAAFAVTDHCDVCFCEKQDVISPIINSYENVQLLKNSDIKLLSGVEIGEGFWYPDTCKKVLSAVPYDVIIGSVHCVRSDITTKAYSSVDFSLFTQDQIYDYLDSYFDDIETMLAFLDFDVLAHLTCPLRYISGRHGRRVDMSRYDDRIHRILRTIIEKEIALEVNTSSYYALINDFSPSRSIIALYKELGGRLITLASDAHKAENAANYFEEAVSELKTIGFSNAFYYENRKPVGYLL
ncbi:MAG: histidinol-phosphatase HisJ family protein [Clostridia bacterium]|nr:histidinol-phosphatase HisJ family protein [Clostridia bacterium]